MSDRQKNQITLFFTSIVTLGIFTAHSVRADNLGNEVPEFQSSPNELNNIKPLVQPNFLLESGSGSQQFFQQGSEQLYLLPENNSDRNLLDIDETIETEDPDFDNFQEPEQSNK